MRPTDVGYLLSAVGKRLAAEPAFPALELGSDLNPDTVDHAIRGHGFVFICPVQRAVFITLDPSSVAPLAALEAFYQLKAKAAVECVVLAYPGDGWKRTRYELFPSREMALKKIEQMARAASRRVAVQLPNRHLLRDRDRADSHDRPGLIPVPPTDGALITY